MLPPAIPLSKFDESKHPREHGRFSEAAGYAGTAGSGIGTAMVLRGITKPHELAAHFAPVASAVRALRPSSEVGREVARGLRLHLHRAWPVYALGAAAGLLAHHLGRDRPGSTPYVAGQTTKHVLHLVNNASLGAAGGQLLGLPLAAVLPQRSARWAGRGLMAAGAAWKARRDIEGIAAVHSGKSDPYPDPTVPNL